MYNQLPTIRHHYKAPYQTYDNVQVDLDATPTFPIGTVVVGHIPLNKQSAIRPGRGIELIAIGCANLDSVEPNSTIHALTRLFIGIPSNSLVITLQKDLFFHLRQPLISHLRPMIPTLYPIFPYLASPTVVLCHPTLLLAILMSLT